MPYKTHLSVLEEAASTHPTRAVFRLPPLDDQDQSNVEEAKEWRTVTYDEFHRNVQNYARYWSRIFSIDGVPPRAIIGLWLSGTYYNDALHMYGIARAGYVPQLFSLRLPNPDIIYELLEKAGAKALVYDTSYASIVKDAPVPSHVASEVFDLAVDESFLPPLPEPTGEDTVMIFHTSGSTSGSPKLVRCSYKWLAAMLAKAELITKPRNPLRQDVTVWMGSMSHIAQNFMLWGSLQHGSCTIQPTKLPFPTEELMDMISICGLNRLNQFATFLSTQLRASRKNTKLLDMLKGLDEVVYSGLALPHEDEEWAKKNQIRLINLFGSTEVGAMLISVGGLGNDSRFLRTIEGTSYGFQSVTPTTPETSRQPVNANTQLKELVILSDSGDCPDPSLRSPEDGHFHTGDLFLEVLPGRYISRGRDDDWIKSENSLRCDTKAIEDNVRTTCADLISECIVVGNGRPSPALFIEPKADLNMDEERLKRDILRRIRPFHSRRYLHERISVAKFIFVVQRGTLPRTATKGNIRRRAVEAAYREQLDEVFGMSFQ
ncbi:hypothetical protein C8Q75DRAFT_793759 [Abortiporus biennis]|nr:hypothetical protein C8Q75DRAFT_793759 [Abortiporus biennis]